MNNRVQNSGSFGLPIPPEEAFSLFTAEGEQRWVPGWSPDILGDLPQHPGLVFLTEANSLKTIWTVLESGLATLTHRYSRVTPGHSAGIVEVRLRANGTGSAVAVSYDMTALSLEGEAALAGYRGAAFTDMLAKWQELIETALRSEQLLPA
jgi:hypothetical protein